MHARLALLVVAAAGAAVGLAFSFGGSVSSAATASSSSWIGYSEDSSSTFTHGVRLLNVNTGAHRLLARNQSMHMPSWSPDGKRMAVEYHGWLQSGGRDPAQISVIRLRDGRIHRITHSWAHVYEQPAWSPDGRQIAFSGSQPYCDPNCQGGIWLMNASGGNEQQLTQNESGDYCARWSPDGRQIAFVRYGEAWPARDLWLMQSDGTRQHLLVRGASCAAWSPDGTQLAISQMTGRSTGCGCALTDLYLADSGGAHSRLLIRNGGSATWSPNGKRIVFVRWQRGKTHLWLIRPDGTGLRQLTHGRNSQAAPAWQPIAK